MLCCALLMGTSHGTIVQVILTLAVLIRSVCIWTWWVMSFHVLKQVCINHYCYMENTLREAIIQSSLFERPKALKRNEKEITSPHSRPGIDHRSRACRLPGFGIIDNMDIVFCTSRRTVLLGRSDPLDTWAFLLYVQSVVNKDSVVELSFTTIPLWLAQLERPRAHTISIAISIAQPTNSQSVAEY